MFSSLLLIHIKVDGSLGSCNLAEVVSSTPPGPYFPTGKLRHCFELVLRRCRTECLGLPCRTIVNSNLRSDNSWFLNTGHKLSDRDRLRKTL